MISSDIVCATLNPNRKMDKYVVKPQRSILAIASWVMFLLAALLIYYTTSTILSERGPISEEIEARDLDVSLLTGLYFDVANGVIIAIAGIAMVVLALKEILFRWRTFKLVLNGLALFGTFLVLEAFHKSMLAILLEN
ncbi:MAG: hypothetical protein IH991_04550 [Planctomycetes bacterium]|nr:hypothetical protein [Planctomycetota bacterium]